MIFIFSSQNGETSSKQSDAIGEWIVSVLDIEVPSGETASSVPILFGLNIRNCAHMFLYALLGTASFLFAASLFGLREKEARLQPLYIAACAFAISFLYACFDELHQSFVGGRTATWRDIGIDTIGYTLLIACCLAVFVLIRRRKKKQEGQGENDGNGDRKTER